MIFGASLASVLGIYIFCYTGILHFWLDPESFNTLIQRLHQEVPSLLLIESLEGRPGAEWSLYVGILKLSLVAERKTLQYLYLQFLCPTTNDFPVLLMKMSFKDIKDRLPVFVIELNVPLCLCFIDSRAVCLFFFVLFSSPCICFSLLLSFWFNLIFQALLVSHRRTFSSKSLQLMVLFGCSLLAELCWMTGLLT